MTLFLLSYLFITLSAKISASAQRFQMCGTPPTSSSPSRTFQIFSKAQCGKNCILTKVPPYPQSNGGVKFAAWIAGRRFPTTSCNHVITTHPHNTYNILRNDTKSDKPQCRSQQRRPSVLRHLSASFADASEHAVREHLP